MGIPTQPAAANLDAFAYRQHARNSSVSRWSHDSALFGNQAVCEPLMIRREVANRELITTQVLAPGNARVFGSCRREAGNSTLQWTLTVTNPVLGRSEF